MRTKILNIFLLTILISVLNFANTSRDLGPEPKLDLKKINQYILFYTNLERLKYGKTPFVYGPILEKAAIWQSEYNKINRRLSHYSSTTGMNSPGDRIKHFGGDWMTYGENVTVNFSNNTEGISYYVRKDSKGSFKDFKNFTVYWRNEMQMAYAMVRGWMNSPGHRANILNNSFNSMGAGTTKGVYNTVNSYYGTQVFTGKKIYNFSKLSIKRKETDNKEVYAISYPNVLEVKVLDVYQDKKITSLEISKVKEDETNEYIFTKPIKVEGDIYIVLYDKQKNILYPVKKL